MAIHLGMKVLAQGFALMLMARGALAGGFGLGDIGKAVEAVGKDLPEVREVVEDRAQLTAADPQKVVGDASKGAHLPELVDPAKTKDAVTSAVRSVPASSQSVPVVVGGVSDGSQAVTELQRRGWGSAMTPAAPATEATGGGAAEKSRKAAQHTLSELFHESGVAEAVKEVTSGMVAEAIAEAEPSSIEDAASRFASSDRTAAQTARDSGVSGIDGTVRGSVDPGSQVSQTLSRAVGSRVPEAVWHPVQQAAEDPQRLAGDAGKGAQALAGADASEAAGAVVDATRRVPGPPPAVSTAMGDDAKAARGLGKRAEDALSGAGERYQQAAQGVLGALLQDTNFEGAVAEVTSRGSRGSAEAIAKADPSRIEDAASRVARNDQTIAEVAHDTGVNGIGAGTGVAEAGSALDQAVDQTVNSLEGEKGIAGAVADTRLSSLVDKTKTTVVKDLVNFASTDGSKQDMAAAKSATWQDLADAVGGAKKDDLESAARSIAKSNFLEPVGGADVKGERSGRGVGGHSGVLLTILAGFLCICYAGVKQFADVRSEGMSMLGDDSEQDSDALESRWNGTSARDIVSSSQSRNPAAFGQL